MRHGWRYLVPLFAISLLFSATVHAQAGPPFRTDDPETPGNKRWEINVGWLGDRNSDEGDYSVPNFDINYGLGDRIQLKYELAIDLNEVRGDNDDIGHGNLRRQEQFDLELGESLLGIKWRFYEHTRASIATDTDADETPEPNFSISTYPQLALKYPATWTPHEGVSNRPQFLLPIEVNARIGPVRVDGEAGYWFTGRDVPQSWIRGVMVGRELTRTTNVYLELYDRQEANRVNGVPKEREATIGLGGRHELDKKGNIILLLMDGRSFQKVQSGNAQPSWIAYAGIQFLFGPKQKGKLAEGDIPHGAFYNGYP